MRIAHLSTLHTALDVRIFQKECRTLAACGHDVHFVVPNPPAEPIDGVAFHHFQKPAHRFRPGRIGHRLARMYRLAAKLKADVYHFHDPELITVGLLLKRRGARVVYDVHEESVTEALVFNRGTIFEGRLKALAWRTLEGMARRSLDAFVAATPTIARHFPQERTYLVQNFPRLDDFSSPLDAGAYADRPARLVYAGALTDIRGAREMVLSLEHLGPNSPARLSLLGQFHPPALQTELAQRPGWARVDFRGYQPRAIVQQVLNEARIGLVVIHPEPGLTEALPTKLFEYMAAGLPVISSDIPLWKQIVDDAGCGLTVNPRDPAAIARAIEYLLDHPGEAEAMGRRGREAVSTRYNWECESRQLLELYERLAAA